MTDAERLERKLLRAVSRAIDDFDLVEAGDRILVAVSGGKDSYTLLHLLNRLRQRAPVAFDLVAVNLDQGHPGFPAASVEAHLRSVGVPYRMLREDTLAIVRRDHMQGVQSAGQVFGAPHGVGGHRLHRGEPHLAEAAGPPGRDRLAVELGLGCDQGEEEE